VNPEPTGPATTVIAMAAPRLLLALVAAVLLAGACSDDGDGPLGSIAPGGSDAPAPSAAPPDEGGQEPEEQPEAPPEEQAPEPTSAPAGPPPTTPADTGSDDDTDWLPIVLLIGGVAIVVALFVASRRSRSQPSTTASSPRANLLSTSQWVHDQLSLELLAADPQAALQRWSIERSRLDNVAIGAQQQYAEGRGDAWKQLGATMSTLASTLDTNLRLRAQQQPDPTLIAQSTDVVNEQRAALQQWIAVLRPTLSR
jgi:hypothetical protein